jgi:hypothetical protein
LEGSSRFSLDDEIRKIEKEKSRMFEEEQRDKEQSDKRSRDQQKNLMKSDSHIYECLNSDEEEHWRNDWRDQRNYRGFNADRFEELNPRKVQRSDFQFGNEQDHVYHEQGLGALQLGHKPLNREEYLEIMRTAMVQAVERVLFVQDAEEDNLNASLLEKRDEPFLTPSGRKWSPGKQSSLTTLRDHVTGAGSKHSTPSHTSIQVTKHTSPARAHEDGKELARSLDKDLERLHNSHLELGKQSQAQGGEERDDRDEADNDILEMTKRLAGMGKALVEEDYMTRATLMKEFVHHTDQIIANRT